jgi:hypothetical protein
MKNYLLLALFVLFKFVLHYALVDSAYELHRDEFMHLDQANHLAWGFQSIPPFTSWISVLIKWLGNTEFWVKFFPGLFGALTLVVVWKTIEELKGSLFAQILGAVCILASVLLRLNILYQPNSFDVLAWTTGYYFFLKYLNSSKPQWLYFLAVIFGLGVLNKYNIAFQLLALFIAMLFTGARKMLFRREFYFALGLGFLIVLPNLIWQCNQDFPVLHHMAQLKKYHLVHVKRADFLIDQLFYFIGSLPILAASFYALYKSKVYRVFLLAFFFTIVLFLYFKAKSYYAVGLYPFYIGVGAAFVSDFIQKKKLSFLKPVLVGLPVLFLFPLIYLDMPIRSPQQFVAFAAKHPDLGMHRWEDGKKYPISQDFADMIGWKELAEKVEAAVPDSGNTLIICDNYGQAGAINYYSQGRVKADAFHDDYRFWFDLDKPYQHLIRVKDAGQREAEFNETLPFFKNGILADSIANQYAREFKTDIFLFTDANTDIRERIRKELKGYY